MDCQYCGNGFRPSSHRQKYCSPTCKRERDREAASTRYHSLTPEQREAKNKRQRELYANIKDKKQAYRQTAEYKAKAKARRNTEAYRAWRRQNEKARAEINPSFRLYRRVKASIHLSLTDKAKDHKWAELLGWTVDDLRRHLEAQFEPWMNWENYGAEWHIDHIIPRAAFNYESPNDIDFKRCWALDNLRPLAARENLQKRDRLDAPFQPALAMVGGG